MAKPHTRRQKEVANLLRSIEQHVSPKSNPVFARYKFHQKIQSPDESVEQFTTELQILAQDCEFTSTDEMIRDRIVFGTNSMKTREMLFNEGAGLTLERAINIARSFEASQAQLKAMNPAGNERKIDVISRPKSRNIPPKHGTSAQAAQQCNLKSTQAAHWHRDENPANNCENCGRSHNKSEACPARGQTCNYCKKKGHFIQVCRKRCDQNKEFTKFKTLLYHLKKISRPWHLSLSALET